MEIIALIGPSGSGKSHRALIVSHEYEIDIIIDDGLAIKGSQILAGISAKNQPTKIGAIKTALFTDYDHAKKVQDAITNEDAERILILGTSLGMVKRISQRLKLPQPKHILYISEIATEKEIEQAYFNRKKFNHHVIPAPTFAVKPKFSGIVINPLKIFFHNRSHGKEKFVMPVHVEQTIVRPTFHYLGKFYITDSAIQNIINITIANSELPVKITKIELNSTSEGIMLYLEIILNYGVNIPEIAHKVQSIILKQLESMTAMNVLTINVFVKSLLK